MPDPSRSKRLTRALRLSGALGAATLLALAAPAGWVLPPASASADIAASMDLAAGLASATTARLGNRLERLRDPDVVEASGVDLTLRIGSADTEAAIDPWLDDVPQPILPTGFDGFRLREAPSREMTIRRDARSSGALDLWWMGELDLGRQGSGMLDPGGSTAALSAGLDTQVSGSRSVGLAFGLDRRIADSAEPLTAPSLSSYASFHPTPQSFVDMLSGIALLDGPVGVGLAGGAFLQGSAMGFGAVTFGLEHREGRWLIAPYGRVEASAVRLATAAPSAGDKTGQAISRRASIVGGLRADYTLRTGGFLVRPGLRFEVLRDLGQASATGLGTLAPPVSSRFTLTPGVRADFSPDWSARLEHRSTVGPDASQQTVELKINGRF